MKLKCCLACGSKNLHLVLDLGKQPLANNYGETKKYPLATNGCCDCGHMQLTYSVSPKKLYSHYLYESGTSQTLKDWFESFASRLTRSNLLDIASNDGSFLRAVKKVQYANGKLKCDLQGIDPAENLIPDDIPTRLGFFGEDTTFNRRFGIITAFNVIAHTPDPLSIMKGIKNNLKPGGIAYVMTSQGNQLDTGQFDTIYHEHHSYFTKNSMRRLVQRAGLEVEDISYEPIHGGSMLTTIRNWSAMPDEFVNFRNKATTVIDTAKSFEPKYRMVAVGAAAKGVVFLNATGLKPEVVADEAKLKWGHTIPGTDIPVVSLKELVSYDEPLTIVYLAWNFEKELKAKVKKLRPKHKDEHVRFFK